MLPLALLAQTLGEQQCYSQASASLCKESQSLIFGDLPTYGEKTLTCSVDTSLVAQGSTVAVSASEPFSIDKTLLRIGIDSPVVKVTLHAGGDQRLIKGDLAFVVTTDSDPCHWPIYSVPLIANLESQVRATGARISAVRDYVPPASTAQDFSSVDAFNRDLDQSERAQNQMLVNFHGSQDHPVWEPVTNAVGWNLAQREREGHANAFHQQNIVRNHALRDLIDSPLARDNPTIDHELATILREDSESSVPVGPPGSGQELAAEQPQPLQNGPFWNSWIKDSLGNPVTDLISGCTYTFNFDAAIVDYYSHGFSQFSPSAASSGIVSSHLESHRGKPELRITSFHFGDATLPSLNLTTAINLDKLSRIPDGANERALTEGLPTYADEVSAVRVSFSVQAKYDVSNPPFSPGCATVGFSAWTAENPPKPLESVARFVRVAGSDGHFVDCGESARDNRGKPAQLVTDLPIVGDASFYTFEIPDNTAVHTMAVFVQKDKAPLWWELIGTLESDLNQLQQTVKTVNSPTSAGNSYRFLYSQVDADIFTSKNHKQQGDADKARALMRQIADRGQPPRAKFITRLIGSDGNPVFYPVGLMSDLSGTKPLASTSDFIETLPSEHPRKCVQTWTKELSECSLQLLASGLKCPAFSSAVSGEDLDKLQNHLVAGQDSEGILLLAHQNNGGISFCAGGLPLTTRALGAKRYSESSAGILIMCNERLDQIEAEANWPFEFNRRGMDTLILSPFTIPENFGACFAAEFAKQINTATDAHQSLTPVQMYRNAVEELGKNKDWKPFLPVAYQFILAGDVEVPICSQSGTPSSF